MLEPSSTDCLIRVANDARLLEAEPVAEMLERLAQGAAGADLEIGHVDVGGERRIGVAELAADALERRPPCDRPESAQTTSRSMKSGKPERCSALRVLMRLSM